jgi:hypothetical protein
MTRTRASLFYLVGYLTFGGLGLVAAPELATRLLFSTGHYTELTWLRVAGALMLALAVIAAQIIRHRVEVLYPTTLLVRIGLLGVLVALYLTTADRMFLTLVAIVGLGLVLTGSAYLSERRKRAAA